METLNVRPARLWLLVGAVWLAGCQPSVEKTSANYRVFGTEAQVTVRHPADRSPDAVLSELGQHFQRLHRDWHPWEPGALTALNQGLQTGNWASISPELLELLDAAQTYEIQTQGEFNAAIGQVVSLWGFHTSSYPITTPPPTPTDIDRLIRNQPSTLDIKRRIDSSGEVLIQTSNPSVGLDFSALAKGAAAGQACDLLAQSGFDDALVNLGGDVLVCGPTETPWRVAIQDPRSGILEVLEVSERLAVFTSGQYYRYGEWEGERYAHVLNPATGYPIEHILQATAIHPDPILADAAATALVVAGFEQAKTLGETLGLEEWLVVNEAGDVLRMGPD